MPSAGEQGLRETGSCSVLSAVKRAAAGHCAGLQVGDGMWVARSLAAPWSRSSAGLGLFLRQWLELAETKW